jgi:Peptidase M50B-like
MKRQHQLELIAATLAFSWLAMQAVHEFGHVLAGVTSGGKVAQVVLHPTTISFTGLTVNPHPLFVAWMGPPIGAVLPVLALLVARWRRWRGWYVFQFFAGFTLIANGAYIAFGSLWSIGDAGDLLRYHSPVWLLWLFGLITIPIGLWLWNDLGPHFGLGEHANPVDQAVAHFMFACVMTIMLLEITYSSNVAKP